MKSLGQPQEEDAAQPAVALSPGSRGGALPMFRAATTSAGKRLVSTSQRRELQLTS